MFDSAHQNDNFWSQFNKIKDKSINHKVNVSKNETQPWLRRYWDSVFISADKFDWSVIQNESCHTVVTSISRCQGLPTTQFISYNGLFVIQPTEGSEVARRSWWQTAFTQLVWPLRWSGQSTTLQSLVQALASSRGDP